VPWLIPDATQRASTWWGPIVGGCPARTSTARGPTNQSSRALPWSVSNLSSHDEVGARSLHSSVGEGEGPLRRVEADIAERRQGRTTVETRCDLDGHDVDGARSHECGKNARSAFDEQSLYAPAADLAQGGIERHESLARRSDQPHLGAHGLESSLGFLGCSACDADGEYARPAFEQPRARRDVERASENDASRMGAGTHPYCQLRIVHAYRVASDEHRVVLRAGAVREFDSFGRAEDGARSGRTDATIERLGKVDRYARSRGRRHHSAAVILR